MYTPLDCLLYGATTCFALSVVHCMRTKPCVQHYDRAQAKQYLQGLRGTLGLFLRKALPELWLKYKLPADPKIEDLSFIKPFLNKLVSTGFIGAMMKEHFKCAETGMSNADVKKVIKRKCAVPLSDLQRVTGDLVPARALGVSRPRPMTRKKCMPQPLFHGLSTD